jgi:hypothetical protein
VFSYFGRKKKIGHLYPKPEFETIIEPFAGAAFYSLTGDNWQKNVILTDLNDDIYRIWSYLIRSNESDIEKLPNLYRGCKIKDLDVDDDAKILLGFCCSLAPGKRKYTTTEWAAKAWPRNKAFIKSNIHKVKHWSIFHKSYNELENIEATWFIDPPYKIGGKEYKYHNIDYNSLSNWCLERKGQIIVCENSNGGDWLPFRPLCDLRTTSNSITKELIYTN